MNKNVDLIDENNKNIVFSHHLFFPGTMIVGSLFSYLKTISQLNCFLIISETVHSHIKERIDEVLKLNSVFIFKGEPTIETLEKCKASFNDLSCDCILAIGGGSVMDLAKSIKKDIDIPLILVPTTPGTGSEATPYALLTDDKIGKKIIIHSKKLLPQVVILDGSLLETIPQKQLAYSVMDTLAHSLEALVSKRANQLSDTFALESIRLVLENYDKVLESGGKAYENLLIASFLGGLAPGMASVGLIHAFAHYFGSNNKLGHGKVIAIFIDEIIKLNMSKFDQDNSKYGKLDKLKITNQQQIINDIIKIKNFFNIYDEKIEVSNNFDKSAAINAIKTDICALTNPIRASDEELGEIITKKIVESETKL